MKIDARMQICPSDKYQLGRNADPGFGCLSILQGIILVTLFDLILKDSDGLVQQKQRTQHI